MSSGGAGELWHQKPEFKAGMAGEIPRLFVPLPQ